jgi:choice-of-anchor A domain-containing protein
MRSYSIGSFRATQRTSSLVVALALLGFFGVAQTAKATGFSLGDAANFVLLDEGYGSNTLSFGAGTIDGNIGIGDPAGGSTSLSFGSGAYLNGNIDFAGSTSAVSGTNSGTATIHSGVTSVQTDLIYLNNLSSTLGAETGTGLTVNLGTNQSQTINASSGVLDASGNEVFTVNAFTFSKGATLTINGNGLGHNVVINFTNAGVNPNFLGAIKLTGGLGSSNVLFNISSGAALNFSDNKSTISGTFLDPNGAITGSSVTIDGHVYGGGNYNMQIVTGTNVISSNQ